MRFRSRRRERTPFPALHPAADECREPGGGERRRGARSGVDRIARRAGLTRFRPGGGKNGMVRYIRKEVEAYEASRRVVMA
jgi:hypothetical protein